MAGQSRRFDTLRVPDVSTHIGENSIVLLPLGAIEQHGPHLPLNTDLIIAESVAHSAIEKYGSETDTWLLPTLPFTKSNEHAWSAGTLWVSASTMLALLDDLARGIAATGARKLVFLNGHGGNSSLLSVACREIRLKFGLQTFLAHPHLPADQGGSSGGGELGMGVHGGMDETSVMMHLRPDLVDDTALVRRVPEKLSRNKHVKFGGSVSFGWLSNDFFAEGHIGDPTGASPDVGARMFERSVETLGEILREVSTFDFGR